jgi:hypothetical protein
MKPRLRWSLAFALLLLALPAAGLLAPAPYTRLELTDADSSRVLLSAALPDGEPVTLTWHNSIFDLPVVEAFYAERGQLVLDRVTFVDPRGAQHAPVSPEQIAELYHTGGPFSASGLNRPYAEVVFRVGEIGDPKLSAQGQTVALKAEVGFGGRVRMETARLSWAQVIVERLQR